jgi:hypothetical protein
MKLLSAVLSAFVAYAASGAPIAQEDGSRVWIGRPWEFRYVLKIDKPRAFETDARIAKADHATDSPDIARMVEMIMPDVKTYLIPNEYYESDNKVATLLMTFNEQGKVTSRYDWPHVLYGRLNRIGNLVLAPGNGPDDLQFRLGIWYTGRSSDEVGYVPAICTADDEERYRKGFSGNTVTGGFGCREWGYYLQNPDYPYIDITSYQWGEDYSKKPNKQGKYPLQRETYIRPVIGWGRFDVTPKPVIGRHGTNWICLYECPNGDAPGIIPDIKAWATKNGWPVPKTPKKMPMFPDRQYKQGEFVD